MNGMKTNAPMTIRKTVAVAFMVCRTTVRSRLASSERRQSATRNVSSAPTAEASTGVKKPVYIPPIVIPTTRTIGTAAPIERRRSPGVARSPAGPFSGRSRPVIQIAPMQSSVRTMPGTTPAMNRRPIDWSVSTA